MKVHWVSRADCFICERQNIMLNYFIYIETMKYRSMKYRSDVMKLESFSDSLSSKVNSRTADRIL